MGNIQNYIVVKETFEANLIEAKENHRKDLERAMIDAKNKANETIFQLNKQIILERGKMLTEQQNNNQHLETEFQMKEARLENSILEIEEREKAWQKEKGDVL